MLRNLGFGELLLIVGFIIIFFGAKRLPGLAQSLGKGIREFRKAARDEPERPADRPADDRR